MEAAGCSETLPGVLKMEIAGSSEMLLSTYQTTRSHNPEDLQCKSSPRSNCHVTGNMTMKTFGGRDARGASGGATYLTKGPDAFMNALFSVKS
jgi:hypothetical protein